MRRAIKFARYLVDHALIAFDMMGADPGLETARKLWKAIDSGRHQTFAASQIWHPLRGGIKTAKEAEPGFEVLVQHNLIEEVHTASMGKPGRPGRKYRVNPIIVEGWR
jgi:hypothetical protein